MNSTPAPHRHRRRGRRLAGALSWLGALTIPLTMGILSQQSGVLATHPAAALHVKPVTVGNATPAPVFTGTPVSALHQTNSEVRSGDMLTAPVSPTRNGRTQLAMCTLGPVLTERFALTAAHCFTKGQTITVSETGTTARLAGAYPHRDIAVIEFTSAGAPVHVDALGPTPGVGEEITKLGARTGRTTGRIDHTDAVMDEPSHEMPDEATLAGLPGEVAEAIRADEASSPEGARVVLSTLCVQQGDSGSPVVDSQDRMVGVVSSSSSPDCGGEGYHSAFTPIH